jgi:hypothetical protein
MMWKRRANKIGSITMIEPIVVSYGGGTNSTALLCGMIEKHLPSPDAVIFSDTGGETPEIYDYIAMFSVWMVDHGLKPITVVQRVRADHVTPNTLEADCLRSGTLPSLAYGSKRCSQKFKIQPFEKWMNHWHRARTAWQSGYKVVKVIGYDAGESHRAANAPEDAKYRRVYPLIEWGWDREDCIDAIRRAGLSLPGKSSCFFCPASKKSEIEALAAVHPLLFRRALAIEDAAREQFQSVKGLGRRFSWRDVASIEETCGLEMPCECVD